jgi:hypothetical protein
LFLEPLIGLLNGSFVFLALGIRLLKLRYPLLQELYLAA